MWEVERRGREPPAVGEIYRWLDEPANLLLRLLDLDLGHRDFLLLGPDLRHGDGVLDGAGLDAWSVHSVRFGSYNGLLNFVLPFTGLLARAEGAQRSDGHGQRELPHEDLP